MARRWGRTVPETFLVDDKSVIRHITAAGGGYRDASALATPMLGK